MIRRTYYAPYHPKFTTKCLSETPGIPKTAQITAWRNCVSQRVCWTCTNMCFVSWGGLARILLGHLAQKIFAISYILQYFLFSGNGKLPFYTYSSFEDPEFIRCINNLTSVTHNTILSMTSLSKNFSKPILRQKFSHCNASSNCCILSALFFAVLTPSQTLPQCLVLSLLQ